MNSKKYGQVSGLVFLIVALAHFIRILNGWHVTVSHWTLPIWASWVGVIVAGYLASQGLKKK